SREAMVFWYGGRRHDALDEPGPDRERSGGNRENDRLTRAVTATGAGPSRNARAAMNSQYRKPLPGTQLDYFDAREAVDRLQPGAWDRLPYTARVHAENIVRRAEPDMVD